MRSRLSAAFLVGAAFGIAGCSGDGPSSTTGPNDAAVFGVNASRAYDRRVSDFEMDHAPGFHRGFPPLGQSRAGIIDPLVIDRIDDTWQAVKFSPPFPQNARVIVIPMTQTYNGFEPPGLRIQNVTHEGFEIRFDELVFGSNLGRIETDGFHVDEAVGWVAHALGGPHAGEMVVSR